MSQGCCGNNPRDTCACRCCEYPNGIYQTIFAQTVLFFGLILSAASLVDCEFVKAKASSMDIAEFATITEGQRRGLGFFFFQNNAGECVWADDNYNIDGYFDFLGADWNVPRWLGCAAQALSILLWFWTLSFSCSAHPRALRYLLATLHILVLMVFQLSTFSIMNSDFCGDYDCELGRSAIFSIGASFCFLVSGLLFIFMNDYPGKVIDEMEEDDDENGDKEDKEESEAGGLEETDEESFGVVKPVDSEDEELAAELDELEAEDSTLSERSR